MYLYPGFTPPFYSLVFLLISPSTFLDTRLSTLPFDFALRTCAPAFDFDFSTAPVARHATGALLFLLFLYGSGPSCIYAGPEQQEIHFLLLPSELKFVIATASATATSTATASYLPYSFPDVLVLLRIVSTPPEVCVPLIPRVAPRIARIACATPSSPVRSNKLARPLLTPSAS